MKSGRRITLIAILLFVVLSWNSWMSIEASVVSLCSYVVLVVTEPSGASNYWRAELPEYWLAALAWLAAGFFLLYRLVYRKSKSEVVQSSGQALARGILVAIVVCSVAAPVLVSVRPEAQGNLVTTRLLPPASSGVMFEPLRNDAVLVEANQWMRRYEHASNFLLDRVVAFSGNAKQVQEPAMRQRPIVFLLGTDDNGRDVLSRLLFGARASLSIGFIAALGALTLGVLVGFVSGYGRAIVDASLMRATDFALSLPSLFVVIAGVAFLGTSTFTLIVILSLTGWMGIARIVRSEIQRLREQEFILAARMLGRSAFEIFTSHFLPNLKPILVTSFVLQFGNAVLAESSLSFLGLGIQPPTPSWGNMLGQSLSYIHSAWWLGFFPGVALSFVLIVAHCAGQERGCVN